MTHDHQPVEWRAVATVRKFRAGEHDPYETYREEGNLLMYGGASALWERLIGTSVTAFNNANAYLCVGDSSAAAVPTQTDLLGSNTHREAMDSTFPDHTDGDSDVANAGITFKSTFETGDANFTWSEWGIANASSSGRLLNRKVFSPGTKTSADSWEFTVSILLA